MKAFLKDNAVLVTSLSLPLILVILFAIVQFTSNIAVSEPKYSVIFMIGNSNSHAGYNVYVNDNKVHYNYQAPKKEQSNYSHYSRNKPRVFIYNPQSKEKIELDTPVVNDFKTDMSAVLDGVPNGNISTKLESSDGYILETNYYRHGNLLSEVFGGYNSRSKYNISLKKNGKKIVIPAPDSTSRNYYYRNSQFLGWIE